MASYALLSSMGMAELLADAKVEGSDFSMLQHSPAYSGFFPHVSVGDPDALIVEALYPMSKMQDLMETLEMEKRIRPILIFSVTAPETVQYAVSDEATVPRSAELAQFFAAALAPAYRCTRMYLRSTSYGPASTVSIRSDRQNALYELLLGCTNEEIALYKRTFRLDFREQGYYIFFWELDVRAYSRHASFKDVYNFVGQIMAKECETALARHSGGEFFYHTLTFAAVIINAPNSISEKQRSTDLQQLLSLLSVICGSRHAICYLSTRVNSVSEFRFLYDRFMEDRYATFFAGKNRVLRADDIRAMRVDSALDTITETLGEVVKYIKYKINDRNLDAELSKLYLELLKPSLNTPVYLYCATIIGSNLIRAGAVIDYHEYISRLTTDHLHHSTIETEYQYVCMLVDKLRAQFASKRQSKSALLMDAIKYIQSNYNDNITVSDIAGALYISETYLNRIFRKLMDTSTIQYLINYRIEQAKFQLEQTDSSVSYIAFLSGFRDTRHFSKTFKSATGFTPSEYRNQFRTS